MLLDRLAIKSEDHIAFLEAGFFGRSARDHFLDYSARSSLETERLGDVLGNCAGLHPKEPARHSPAGLQLLAYTHGFINRNGKCDSLIATRTAVNH